METSNVFEFPCPEKVHLRDSKKSLEDSSKLYYDLLF